MKKTITMIALTTLFASTAAFAQTSTWDDKNNDPQKQAKFEERKATVVDRLEAGKQKMNEKMDQRIQCAKNATSPNMMRACHKTYSIDAQALKLDESSFQ